MTITKFKERNQITIPQEVVKMLDLKPEELLSVDVVDNYIKLTPVSVEPKYTPEELSGIDRIVEAEKGKGKTFKAGKEFSNYIKKITK